MVERRTATFDGRRPKATFDGREPKATFDGRKPKATFDGRTPNGEALCKDDTTIHDGTHGVKVDIDALAACGC